MLDFNVVFIGFIDPKALSEVESWICTIDSCRRHAMIEAPASIGVISLALCATTCNWMAAGGEKKSKISQKNMNRSLKSLVFPSFSLKMSSERLVTGPSWHLLMAGSSLRARAFCHTQIWRSGIRRGAQLLAYQPLIVATQLLTYTFRLDLSH